MHGHSLAPWTHEHDFLGADHARNERRTLLVISLATIMMVGEVVAGVAYGSMALLADGFHMATHAGALGISAWAYGYARRHARDRSFAFGTGKVGDLAGFTSAIVLALIALLLGYESLERIALPIAIRFEEAIAVASLGLAVNVLSAWLLRDRDHEGGRGHAHHDHNLRSAYLHVLADAATSVLAIAGLLAGLFYGWLWMDPLMGFVGAAVIARWSWGLIRDAGRVLLDIVPDRDLSEQVRSRLEVSGDRVCDLHLWRVGPGHNAAIVSLVSDSPHGPSHYWARLSGLPGLGHVTVEVHPCEAHAAELSRSYDTAPVV